MGNTRGRTVGGMQSRTSTARKTAAKPETPAPEAQVITLPTSALIDDDETGANALDAVLSELGGIDNARVGVYRLDKGGGMQYVATLTPDEVQGEASLLEAIRRDYGGGEYRIHVRDGAGLIANRRVSIAERKQQPAPDVGLAAVLTATLDRFQSQLTQALQVVQRPPVSEADAEERVLNRMKTMAEIIGPRGGGGVEAQALMATLTQGIELGKQMGGAGGDDGSNALMAQTLQTIAAVVIQGQQQPRRPAPGRQAAAPAPALPAATAPAAPAQEPAGDDERVKAMRTLLQVVLSGAAQGSEAELYAALVADQLGEDGVSELLQFPDPVAMLVQIEPAAGAYREWLGELAQELRNLQEGADDGANAQRADGDPGRPGRRDAHPGPDAGPGA